MPQSREAHRRYMQERRARERAGSHAVAPAQALAAVVALPVAVEPGESVAQAVEADLARWPMARFRQTDAAAARVLARRLDDPFTPAGAAATLSRELGVVLDRLRPPERSSGALARMRAQQGSSLM